MSQNMTLNQNQKPTGPSSWEKVVVRDRLELNLYQIQGKLYAGKAYRGHIFHLSSDNRFEGRYTQVTLSLPPSIPPSRTDTSLSNIAALLYRSQKYRLLTGRLKIDEQKSRLIYEQPDRELTAKHYEHIFDLLVDWADTVPTLSPFSGEQVMIMKPVAEANKMLRPAVRQLLKRLAHDTKTRLADRLDRLWCPRCRARFVAHQVDLSAGSALTYYGCRSCLQSKDFLVGQIIVVLDNHQEPTISKTIGKVRVNWAMIKQPFDFDAIEIGQVDDEAVERFAMQIGNDTDPLRRPRYKRLPCYISPDNRLSANSVRILQHIFGEVVRG